jgi:cell division protein FtsI (penicillin-binding protein 3)
MTAAAALEAGLFETSDLVDCGRGSLRVGRTRVEDHKPFGVLTFTDVFVNSSNVGAARIGQRVGRDRLHSTLSDFGFGRRTGVDLPGENPGLLRPPSAWTDLSVVTISFGQEISVTPLQLATAFSAVANGGILYRPRVVRAVLDSEGQVRQAYPPRRVRRVISKETAQTLREIMRQVVERGTGRQARLDGYTAAGKTGTAQQIGPSGTYEEGRVVASFAGFAPAENPRIVVVVTLEEPRTVPWGGVVAAPVFKAMAEDVLRYLRVPPERDRARLVFRGDETQAADTGSASPART